MEQVLRPKPRPCSLWCWWWWLSIAVCVMVWVVNCVRSTDHELIPTMQGSASGSNVRYYPTWKHSPFKTEMNKAVTMLSNYPMFAVTLWMTTSPYRWPIRSLPSTCLFYTPPHCTKDVYTPQGSTRDLWTVSSSPVPGSGGGGEPKTEGNSKFRRSFRIVCIDLSKHLCEYDYVISTCT
jgi:hypothetical protein